MSLFGILAQGCVVVTGSLAPNAPQDGGAVGHIDADTAALATDSGEDGEIDSDALARLADRMAATQNDDGSWDWQRAHTADLTPSETGFQNITGIAALGLRPTIDRLGANAGWQDAHDDAVAYFAGKFAALQANPLDDANLLSSPSWTLIARELERNPDPALQAAAEGALDALITNRDERFGTADETRMDGWVQHNIDRRAGNAGLIPWDLALLTEALHDMAAISPGFADQHAEACQALQSHLNSTFLPAWNANRSLFWGDLSISMPLYVLTDCPDVPEALLATLDAELALLVHADGSVTNGSTDDGPHQGTAYGLLALKRRESPLAQGVQNHAQAQVGADGMLADDGTGMETFEIEGELLRAMAE